MRITSLSRTSGANYRVLSLSQVRHNTNSFSYTQSTWLISGLLQASSVHNLPPLPVLVLPADAAHHIWTHPSKPTDFPPVNKARLSGPTFRLGWPKKILETCLAVD